MEKVHLLQSNSPIRRKLPLGTKVDNQASANGIIRLKYTTFARMDFPFNKAGRCVISFSFPKTDGVKL